MALFASHTPGSQHLVLHAVAEPNPARDGVLSWTETELAKRCAELCGKSCTRQVVGMALRSTLLPKGLVFSRKVAAKHLVWAPTAEARALACLFVGAVHTPDGVTVAQGRRLAAELAPLAADPAAATRALRTTVKAAPPQPDGGGAAQAPPVACTCKCLRCGRQLCCPDLECAQADNEGGGGM